MSVLIKDMKMPISCIECPCSLNLFFCKVYGGKPVTDASSLTINGTTINVKRPDWCPLGELPEYHGRLIDADVVTNKYGKWYTEEGPEEGFIGTIKDIINLVPTVIRAE